MAETFLYLSTIGRVTGNAHTIEIWFVEHEECYYLCSGNYRDADWVKNIVQNASVKFYIAQQEQDNPSAHPAQATVVSDDVLITILGEKFKAKYNWNEGLFIEICASVKT